MQLNKIINLQHMIDIKDKSGEDIFALTNNANTNKIIRDLFINSIKKEKRQTISPRDSEYLYKLLQPQTPFFDKLDRSRDVQRAYLIIKNILCINKSDNQLYICNHVKNNILLALEQEHEKIMFQVTAFKNNKLEYEALQADLDSVDEENISGYTALKVGMINPESPRKYEEIRDENHLNHIITSMETKRLSKISKTTLKVPTSVEIPSEEDILEAMSLHNGSTYTKPEEDKDLSLNDDELADLLARMRAKNANAKKQKTQA